MTVHKESLHKGVFTMTQNNDAFFSRRDLSEMFKVTTQTIIRWEQAGLLTSVHLHSGAVRYRRSEVDRFIARQTEARPTKRKRGNLNPKPETCEEYFKQVAP
jgi:hypothetical protein